MGKVLTGTGLEDDLSQLDLPSDLDTSTAEIDAVLLNPCLKRATSYDRGVGYFSSRWLRRVASGMSNFAGTGGRMRLLTSPILSSEDWGALRAGEEARDDPILLRSLRGELTELEQFADETPVQMLAWMIADELLEVRIAIPTGKLDGDYHPKIGHFTDAHGHSVVFHGSQNETERGFRNFESLDVYCSWTNDSDRHRIESHRRRFERIWDGRDLYVRSFTLPQAIRKNLVQFTSGRRRPYRKPKPRDSMADRWRHQDTAVARFLEARAGILEMATGTGKTRTSLRAASELVERDLIDTVIVTTGGSDLLDQWYTVLGKYGPKWPRFRQDMNHKDVSAYLASPRRKMLLASRGMLPEILSRLPAALKPRTLIVSDEIQGFASEQLRSRLRGLVAPLGFRLGLSATPEREYDDEGNRFIEEEVGPVIFEFGLKKAIARGVLCEFDYETLSFALSDEDKAKRARLIRAHQAAKKGPNPRPDEELYRQLADVRKSSLEKLPVLERFLAAHPETLERSLIFVATTAYGERVQKIIADHTDRFHPYFSDDDPRDLRRFAEGELQCLITCHKLSEGIDIPSVRTILLLSADRAKLETIQRLGRCLRLDPQDPDKRALVVDFLCEEDGVIDPADAERSNFISDIAQTKAGDD